MTPPTRDRSPLCRSQLTSEARRRPRPTSTRVPTTERTIWWQNDVASMSKRSSRASGPSSPARSGDLGEAGVEHPPPDGRPRLGPGHSPAEGAEVVLAEEGVGGAGHGPQVERARHVPRHRGEEGVRGLVLQDEVAVAPGPGRAPGVETGGRRLGGAHGHGRLEQGVHRPHQPGGVHAVAHVDVDDLTPGVDAGVGAPRAHELDGVAHDHADGLGQGPRHRALPGLDGEAPEPGPVVGDRQAQAGRRRGDLVTGAGRDRRRAHGSAARLGGGR